MDPIFFCPGCGADISPAQSLCLSCEDEAREAFDSVHSEIQSRIYRGEIEATDADGVQTMLHQG